jgi:hypothetical protein
MSWQDAERGEPNVIQIMQRRNYEYFTHSTETMTSTTMTKPPVYILHILRHKSTWSLPGHPNCQDVTAAVPFPRNLSAGYATIYVPRHSPGRSSSQVAKPAGRLRSTCGAILTARQSAPTRYQSTLFKAAWKWPSSQQEQSCRATTTASTDIQANMSGASRTRARPATTVSTLAHLRPSSRALSESAYVQK